MYITCTRFVIMHTYNRGLVFVRYCNVHQTYKERYLHVCAQCYFYVTPVLQTPTQYLHTIHMLSILVHNK